MIFETKAGDSLKDEPVKEVRVIRLVKRFAILAIAFLYSSALTACNEPPAPPEIPKPTAPARVIGSELESDPAGDVRDRDDVKLKQPLPGLDITSVRLEGVDSGLKITFSASTDFPKSLPRDQSAIWGITACTPGGKHCLTIDARVREVSWQGTVFDMTANRNIYIDPPAINGKDLIIKVDVEKLPDWMRQPFEWSADSEWSIGRSRWNDHVPDLGSDILNPPSFTFPKP